MIEGKHRLTFSTYKHFYFDRVAIYQQARQKRLQLKMMYNASRCLPVHNDHSNLNETYDIESSSLSSNSFTNVMPSERDSYCGAAGLDAYTQTCLDSSHLKLILDFVRRNYFFFKLFCLSSSSMLELDDSKSINQDIFVLKTVEEEFCQTQLSINDQSNKLEGRQKLVKIKHYLKEAHVNKKFDLVNKSSEINFPKPNANNESKKAAQPACLAQNRFKTTDKLMDELKKTLYEKFGNIK